MTGIISESEAASIWCTNLVFPNTAKHAEVFPAGSSNAARIVSANAEIIRFQFGKSRLKIKLPYFLIAGAYTLSTAFRGEFEGRGEGA